MKDRLSNSTEKSHVNKRKEKVSLLEIQDVTNLDLKIRNYLICAAIFMIIEMILLPIFLSIYDAEPDDAIFIFVVFSLILILFFFFLIKATTTYEKQKETSFVTTEFSRVPKTVNTFLSMMEDFPYEKKLSGGKKTFVKYMGWVVIIVLIIIAILARVGGEFLWRYELFSSLDWAIFFTSGIFALAPVTIIIHLFTDEDYFKILKVLSLGFCIVLQVPNIVNFFVFHQLGIKTNYVEWEHFLLYLTFYFLHPTTGYSSGLGNAVMYTMLWGLSSFYVFFRSYYDFDNKKKRSLSIALLKAFMCATVMYFLLAFDMCSLNIFKTFLMSALNFPIQLYTNPFQFFPEYFFIVFSFYLFSLVTMLFLKIRFDEKQLTKKKETEIKISLESKDRGQIKNIIRIEEDYKSNSRLKYTLLFLFVIFAEIVLFYACY